MPENKFVSSKVRLGDAKNVSLSLALTMRYILTCGPIMKKIQFTVYSVGIQNVIAYVFQAVSFQTAPRRSNCIEKWFLYYLEHS